MRMPSAAGSDLQIIRKCLENEISFDLTNCPLGLLQGWPVRRGRGFSYQGKTCVHRDLDLENSKLNMRNHEKISGSGRIKNRKPSARVDSYYEKCFRKKAVWKNSEESIWCPKHTDTELRHDYVQNSNIPSQESPERESIQYYF